MLSTHRAVHAGHKRTKQTTQAPVRDTGILVRMYCKGNPSQLLLHYRISHISPSLVSTEDETDGNASVDTVAALPLSVLTATFPDEPGSAGFIEAKNDGSGGDNWSCKLCKAPVKLSPPTNQHPTFNRPDVLPVAQPTVSEH